MAAPTPQGSQKTTATGVASLTITLNGGSALPGTNRQLCVDIGWETNRAISSLGLGGQALSVIGSTVTETNTGKDLFSYQLGEAGIAAATDQGLDFVFSANVVDAVFIVDWYSDCDSTTPISSVQTGTGFNTTGSDGTTGAVTSSVDAIVRGAILFRDSDATVTCENAGASQVEEQAAGAGSSTTSHVMEVSRIPGAASVTPDWLLVGYTGPGLPGWAAKAYSVNGIAGGGGITGDSSLALPLSGIAAGTLAISGDSSKALPLSGSAAGALAIAGDSSQALPLAGSATGTLGIAGSSSASLPLGGTATGVLLIQGASSQPLPLGGTATGSSVASGDSVQALPLSGSATGSLLIQGASLAALPLAGTSTGVLAISADSSQSLPLGGSATGSLQITGDSNQPLPLGGTASAGALPAIDAIRWARIDEGPAITLLVREGAALRVEATEGPAIWLTVRAYTEDGSMAWHPDNTNHIEVEPRSEADQGARVLGATVTALIEKAGVPVTGLAANPMVLTEGTGRRAGVYFGAASKDAAIVAGDTLTADIIVDDGADRYAAGTLTIAVTARVLTAV